MEDFFISIGVSDFYLFLNVFLYSFLIVGVVVFLGYLIPKNSVLPKFLWPIFHPNSISFWRGLIGVYAIYFFIVSPDLDDKIFAIYLYVFSAILDKTDGDFARACNLSTVFGESFDPLVDKIQTHFPLAYFSYLGILDWKIYFLYFFLDFVSQFIRIFIKKRGASVAAVNWGKIKTSFAFALVGLVAVKIVFGLNIPGEFFNYILIITCFLAYLSIFGKLPMDWKVSFLKITVFILIILLFLSVSLFSKYVYFGILILIFSCFLVLRLLNIQKNLDKIF